MIWRRHKKKDDLAHEGEYIVGVLKRKTMALAKEQAADIEKPCKQYPQEN